MSSSLADLAGRFVLSGPTVDDDVRRLIYRYGADAVKAAVKQQTAAKRGRKKLPDMPELRPYIEEDAKLWIEGGDPFSKRSDYAIAKALADANPGYHYAATMQRFERKLRAKPYSRKWFTLVTAMQMTEAAHPFQRHLHALRSLLEIDPEGPWEKMLVFAQDKVAKYNERHGSVPDHLTMQEIEHGSLNALLEPATKARGSLFGRTKIGTK